MPAGRKYTPKKGKDTHGGLLWITNPHAIEAALIHRPQEVASVLCPHSTQRGLYTPGQEQRKSDDVWERVRHLMQKHGIAEAAFSDRTERESARNRGTKAGAWVGLKQTVELEDLFHHEILIACDGVLDPQNLGAIIRLAAFFRVGGILLPADRAVGLSATVMDVAVGGVETVALCVVVNLRHALEKLQKAGLWILGTSEHAKTSMYQVDRDRRWCVVLGSEQEGMRPLIEKTCDVLCQIPRPRYEADALLGAGVSSLNVAASAGIVLGHLCSR